MEKHPQAMRACESRLICLTRVKHINLGEVCSEYSRD